jgi:cell division transport system permease protein
MSVLFGISEGFKGLFKARMAITLSISSIILSILLSGIFVVFAFNLQSWIGFLREKIEVEIFIATGTTENEIEKLKTEVKRIRGVHDITFVNMDQAFDRFKEEFGDEYGQDVSEIIGFNPFQPSIIIHVEEGHRNPEGMNELKGQLEQLQNVDDVIYNRPLLEKIDRYIKIFYALATIIGLIILFISIGLIFNTIRLTIYARKDMIHIMRLVGATEGFIKQPFLVEGIIQGCFGAIVASVILYYGLKLIQIYIYPYLVYDSLIFVGLIIFGMIIGFISAHMSLNKYVNTV